MRQLKQQLMLKFSSNEITAAELIDMVVELQEKVDSLTNSTNYGINSQSSHEAAENNLRQRKWG